ncbi:MAG: glycosyltransferase family 4 protein [Pseudomonadota bacterium]
MKKRLLFVHHATQQGGAPISLAFLIRGLDKREFESFVIIPRRPGNSWTRELFVKAGATVLEEQHLRPFHGSNAVPNHTLRERMYALLSFPLTAWTLWTIARRLKPHLVHINSTSLAAVGWGVHFASRKTPVVAHVREPLLQNWWGQFLAWLNKVKMNAFIGIDQAGLDTVNVEPARQHVIYNFIEPESLVPQPNARRDMRKQAGWDENDIVFVYMARIVPDNGVKAAIDLINQTDSSLDPRAKFAFAGFRENPHDYELSVEKEINASPRCVALPFTDDVASLIDFGDVIFVPFLKTHSARSVLEGAVMGKPSMVTNLPNLTELVVEGETGFVFEITDQKSFIDAVNKLCEPNAVQEMEAKTIAHAKSNFDAQTNVAKTASLFRTLIDSR